MPHDEKMKANKGTIMNFSVVILYFFEEEQNAALIPDVFTEATQFL